LESGLAGLSPEEAAEYLKELGVKGSGLSALIHSMYQLLGQCYASDKLRLGGGYQKD
jgi:hypothetical protein